MADRKIGVYGEVEMMRVGGSLRQKRATEVAAAGEIRNPAQRPYEFIDCSVCGECKHYTAFDVDIRCVERWHRRTDCKLCRKLKRVKSAKNILRILSGRN